MFKGKQQRIDAATARCSETEAAHAAAHAAAVSAEAEHAAAHAVLQEAKENTSFISGILGNTEVEEKQLDADDARARAQRLRSAADAAHAVHEESVAALDDAQTSTAVKIAQRTRDTVAMMHGNAKEYVRRRSSSNPNADDGDRDSLDDSDSSSGDDEGWEDGGGGGGRMSPSTGARHAADALRNRERRGSGKDVGGWRQPDGSRLKHEKHGHDRVTNYVLTADMHVVPGTKEVVTEGAAEVRHDHYVVPDRTKSERWYQRIWRDNAVMGSLWPRNLLVTIIGANNLPKMDAVGWCDPYITVSTPGNPNRQRTVIQSDTGNPTWEQTFVMEIMRPNDPIYFELWDWDRLTPDELMSRLLVPLHGKHVSGREICFDLTREVTGEPGGVVRISLSWETDLKPLRQKDRFGAKGSFWYKVVHPGGVQCRSGPDVDSPRINYTLPEGMVFQADRRERPLGQPLGKEVTYVRLFRNSDEWMRQGWVFETLPNMIFHDASSGATRATLKILERVNEPRREVPEWSWPAHKENQTEVHQELIHDLVTNVTATHIVRSSEPGNWFFEIVHEDGMNLATQADPKSPRERKATPCGAVLEAVERIQPAGSDVNFVALAGGKGWIFERPDGTLLEHRDGQDVFKKVGPPTPTVTNTESGNFFYVVVNGHGVATRCLPNHAPATRGEVLDMYNRRMYESGLLHQALDHDIVAWHIPDEGQDPAREDFADAVLGANATVSMVAGHMDRHLGKEGGGPEEVIANVYELLEEARNSPGEPMPTLDASLASHCHHRDTTNGVPAQSAFSKKHSRKLNVGSNLHATMRITASYAGMGEMTWLRLHDDSHAWVFVGRFGTAVLEEIEDPGVPTTTTNKTRDSEGNFLFYHPDAEALRRAAAAKKREPLLKDFSASKLRDSIVGTLQSTAKGILFHQEDDDPDDIVDPAFNVNNNNADDKDKVEEYEEEEEKQASAGGKDDDAAAKNEEGGGDNKEETPVFGTAVQPAVAKKAPEKVEPKGVRVEGPFQYLVVFPNGVNLRKKADFNSETTGKILAAGEEVAADFTFQPEGDEVVYAHLADGSGWAFEAKGATKVLELQQSADLDLGDSNPFDEM